MGSGEALGPPNSPAIPRLQLFLLLDGRFDAQCAVRFAPFECLVSEAIPIPAGAAMLCCMASMWLAAFAVGVGVALVAALLLGQRRQRRNVHDISRQIRAAPPPAAKRRPAERPAPPPENRRPVPQAAELAGVRVRIAASGRGLAVYRQQGSSWTCHVELGWREIEKVYFTSGGYDSAVALYATTSQGKRKQHLVDSRQLNGGQWSELASVVEAWTEGRLVIDLSARTDSRFGTDL
ncbi:hypothetical protein [Amycolatopsis sp. cg13]|uniref:hypothetical protein n=1 Tax=Amycolatopsis sp. cg13 TaxID=3238807 RepID=UPI003526291E